MRQRLPSIFGLLGACCALASWSWPAAAAERQFAYTAQSTVLEPGRSELAPWSSVRAGRQRYFNRIDARLELERGLSDALQLSLFWSFYSQTQDVVVSAITDEVARISESELATFSSQLKLKLTDPAADALGSALSLEAALGSNAAALELKLIGDRLLGKLLLSGNVSGSYELGFVRDGQESKLDQAFVLEPALAAAYVIGSGVSLGLELRAPLGLAGDAASSALFGGPVLAWLARDFWAVLGVQPQLLALSEASPGTHLELTQHEKLTVRLLAGFAL